MAIKLPNPVLVFPDVDLATDSTSVAVSLVIPAHTEVTSSFASLILSLKLLALLVKPNNLAFAATREIERALLQTEVHVCDCRNGGVSHEHFSLGGYLEHVNLNLDGHVHTCHVFLVFGDGHALDA